MGIGMSWSEDDAANEAARPLVERIKELEAEVARMKDTDDANYRKLAEECAAQAERAEKAEEEAGRLRLQLAGCSSASIGYARDCKPDDYGHSVALDDVNRLLGRMEAAEAKAEKLKKALGKVTGNVKSYLLDIEDVLNEANEIMEEGS